MMEGAPHSLTVDESLVRRMARDAAIYSLTRPIAIGMWVVLSASLILGVITLLGTVARGAEVSLAQSWMPPLALFLMIYTVVLTVSSARRAVRAKTPPGSRTWVAVTDDAVQFGGKRGASTLRFDALRGVRVGRDAVILRLREVSVATALPRALFTDADIERLRAQVASTS